MKRNPLSLMIASLLLATPTVYGQGDAAEEAETGVEDRVVVTGTRVAGRSATATAVPVDIIVNDNDSY